MPIHKKIKVIIFFCQAIPTIIIIIIGKCLTYAPMSLDSPLVGPPAGQHAAC